MYSAWGLLVDASSQIDSDLFRYDLVDITKEVLQYQFVGTYTKLMIAYNQSDLYGVGCVRKIPLFFRILNRLIYF